MDPYSSIPPLSESLIHSFSLIPSLILILVLFFFSFILVAWGQAFRFLNKNEITEMKNRGMTGSSLVAKLNKKEIIVQHALMMANIFLRTCMVIFIAFWILANFYHINIWVLIGVFLLVSMFITFFCEILARNFGARKKETMVCNWVILIQFFYVVFLPFAKLFSYFLRNPMSSHSTALSGEEYSDVMEMAEGGEDLETETQILKGLVRFSDLDVKEIMKSRLDIVALDWNLSIEEVIEIAGKTGYSRLPVYETNMDNIKGVLYVKDLLKYMGKIDSFNWHTLVRTCYFTPESKTLSDLLNEFQMEKIHLAIVVDQYGGTSGLITLEDIIEEIVGEIVDEYDATEHSFLKLSDNEYSFEAKTSLVDFCKIVGVDDAIFDEVKGNSESLAGLILELEGEIPVKDTEIKYEQFLFRIEDVNLRRINRVGVVIERSNEDE